MTAPAPLSDEDRLLGQAAVAEGLLDAGTLEAITADPHRSGSLAEALLGRSLINAQQLEALQAKIRPLSAAAPRATLDYSARSMGDLATLHTAPPTPAAPTPAPPAPGPGTLAPRAGSTARGRALVPPPGSELMASQANATPLSQAEVLALGPGPRAFTRRYQMQDELGRGGAGVVLAAEDQLMGRRVAIKVLKAPDASPATRIRFLAEARTTAQLEHPNVVPVHEIGTHPDGRPYFAMKRVKGTSLKDLLAALAEGVDPGVEGPFTRYRLLQIFSQVCMAVDYAHAKGVIHRDLKPDNIMVGGFGEVLVMDWGIAKVVGTEDAFEEAPISLVGEQAHTQAGAIFGTPGYMSPEQARGASDEIDRRTDVWALGAILYELLTGRPPYTGPTALATLMATVDKAPLPPREQAPDREIPTDLEEICIKALKRQRDERYETARELHDEVQRHLTGARERDRKAAEADQLIEEGQETRWYAQMLAEELSELKQHLNQAPPLTGHEPIEQKRARWALEDRLSHLESEREAAFRWAEGKLARALELVPGQPHARTQLARMHWARYREARGGHDAAAARRHLEAVSRYDDGAFTARLAPQVPLTLITRPAGARVRVHRYEERDRRLHALAGEDLGETPLRSVPVSTGKALLIIEAEGHSPVRLPIQSWQGDELAFEVVLPTTEALGEDTIYIPGGAFMRGNDPQAVLPDRMGPVEVPAFAIARFPVTCAEYLAFLNDLPAEEAAIHVPREQGPLWSQDASGRWHLPEADEEGDRWLPEWPVIHVDYADAEAYCAWSSQREGVTVRLPTADEWEKAARGTDGRFFPWGDHFDPTFCCVRGSLEGELAPQPVGRFEADESPYGVRDMAGGVREWTASWFEPGQRTLRGGSWNLYAFLCRPAGRFGQYPTTRLPSIGFRVVREMP